MKNDKFEKEIKKAINNKYQPSKWNLIILNMDVGSVEIFLKYSSPLIVNK